MLRNLIQGEKADASVAWALKRFKAQSLNAADSAGVERDAHQRLAKGLMGILAEAWVCRKIEYKAVEFCDALFSLKTLPPTINKDGEFEQIDILVSKKKRLGDQTKEINVAIEVRSSFNYHSLQNAVFNGFSVLGPYGNAVKPGETVKDVYIFVAIDLHQKKDVPDDLIAKLDGGGIDYAATTTNVLLGHTLDVGEQAVTVRHRFDLILVGGATRDMFGDEGLFEPIKENAGYKNSNFRSIRIPKALDAAAVLKRILAI